MFLCGLDCCVDVCGDVDGEVEAWDQVGIDERWLVRTVALR